MFIKGFFVCITEDLFYHLESIGLLDPNNNLDLFCLHYVFIPCINACLKEWKNAWVKHPLCSKVIFLQSSYGQWASC